MKRFVNRKGLAGIASVSALVASLLVGAVGVGHGITDSHAASRDATFKDYSSFVQYTAKHHKAPFFSHELASQEAMQTYAKRMQQNFHALRPLAEGYEHGGNVKTNQDQNPWPKADIAAAINPRDGKSYVIMHDDFRQNFDHQYYGFSANGGKTWSDDSLADSIDPVTNSAYSVQTDPGVAIDTYGNSYHTSLETNTINDTTAQNGSSNASYYNYDTAVTLTQGFNNGKYTSVIPKVVDYVACNSSTSSCMGSLDAPRVAVDTNNSSSSKGAVYVYYTYFCNGSGASGNGPCTDVNNSSISIPAGTSAILVRQSFDQGMTFSPPVVASGTMTQAQFPDMVIDDFGTPSIIFDDFSHDPGTNAPSSTIGMYKSSLFDGSWSVNSNSPVASFEYNGLNNLHWNFRDIGTVAPGCGIYHRTAYCAFSAWQVGSGPLSGSPNVYVAAVNTETGDSQISRVNNDNFSSNKAHFLPWATTDTKGNVYVGWYDNRNDPNNARVQYFVGKSTNGGRSFPKQKAVSDGSFNPCAFPNCAFFGDYDQLIAGNDDTIHAAWADTRDGSTMQIWCQDIKW